MGVQERPQHVLVLQGRGGTACPQSQVPPNPPSPVTHSVPQGGDTEPGVPRGPHGAGGSPNPVCLPCPGLCVPQFGAIPIPVLGFRPPAGAVGASPRWDYRCSQLHPHHMRRVSLVQDAAQLLPRAQHPPPVALGSPGRGAGSPRVGRVLRRAPAVGMKGAPGPRCGVRGDGGRVTARSQGRIGAVGAIGGGLDVG